MRVAWQNNDFWLPQKGFLRFWTWENPTTEQTMVHPTCWNLSFFHFSALVHVRSLFPFIYPAAEPSTRQVSHLAVGCGTQNKLAKDTEKQEKKNVWMHSMTWACLKLNNVGTNKNMSYLITMCLKTVYTMNGNNMGKNSQNHVIFGNPWDVFFQAKPHWNARERNPQRDWRVIVEKTCCSHQYYLQNAKPK